MIIGERKIEGKTTTQGGYPLPLTGKALTDTPVVVLREDEALREYPEVFVPGQEELAADEIRITCTGSGNPPVRRAQAATGWLVELGNGDKFVFDVGGGTVQNLWSLMIHPALLDKLFLTHLHLDHVGDFHVLYDAMGWARNTPLRVWGPSGATKELGTTHFCELMDKAAFWHTQSKRGIIPGGGMEIEAKEFDVSQFSPENPRTLVYDENGVKIYAFPVAHILIGAVGYRLEWNGLSWTFNGDGEPNTFEAEQAKGVDVFMHEAFLDGATMSKKMHMPLEQANIISGAHSTSDRVGKIFEIAKPKLGVAYHYFQDDETIDPFFENLRKTYAGPVVLAQDLTVINLTQAQIVTRQAQTDLLNWTPPAPPSEGPPPELDPKSPGTTPQFVVDTILPVAED
ncbi:MAG: MBL fold metallo-hydrolase [Deltaproteobacteria bacterium]|nr:MBL fold metallo-hydrolase [Deltaproteobacteria bacterium]